MIDYNICEKCNGVNHVLHICEKTFLCKKCIKKLFAAHKEKMIATLGSKKKYKNNLRKRKADINRKRNWSLVTDYQKSTEKFI
jgi:hypothetical protein